MKQSLNAYQVADLLRKDENASWSYEGAKKLAEYLIDIEEDLGEEMEFCPVAIRCDWSEFATIEEVANDYDIKDEGGSEEERETQVLEWLNDRTTVLEIEGGGYIVRAF